MNFLQLAKRACIECDDIPASQLITVANQTGELQRVINWVNAAWIDVQSARGNWPWMRKSITPFSTVAAQAIYTAANAGVADLNEWKRDSFRVYTTAAGMASEQSLEFWDYEDWRDLYQFGSMRTSQGIPSVVTITPGNSLAFGPVPTGDYSIVGDYYSQPIGMVADSDTPSMPAQFHMAIVHRAKMFYGAFAPSPEHYDSGEKEFNLMIARLRQHLAPEFRIG